MRLFVALDLPGDVRADLAGWARSAVGDDGRLRLVPEESLHVTLVFVGERPDAGPLAAAMHAALEPVPAAPPLRVDGPLWLAPRRPHVLTVSLEDPSGGLAAMQSAVLDGLVRDAGHEAERRPFRAHVTVARVRAGLRPFELAPPPSVQFRPPAVTLYRSRLNTAPRAPATYEAVSSVPLSTLS